MLGTVQTDYASSPHKRAAATISYELSLTLTLETDTVIRLVRSSFLSKGPSRFSVSLFDLKVADSLQFTIDECGLASRSLNYHKNAEGIELKNSSLCN